MVTQDEKSWLFHSPRPQIVFNFSFRCSFDHSCSALVARRVSSSTFVNNSVSPAMLFRDNSRLRELLTWILLQKELQQSKLLRIHCRLIHLTQSASIYQAIIGKYSTAADKTWKTNRTLRYLHRDWVKPRPISFTSSESAYLKFVISKQILKAIFFSKKIIIINFGL